MKTHATPDWPRAIPADDFRRRLAAELDRRRGGNPRYSLRAFAADLGLDHSTLSQLLRGRRRLTEPVLRALAERLRLSPEETARYVAAQPVLERRADEAVEAPTLLAEDVRALAAEWEHLALLELTRLAAFRPDSRWIARSLAIPVDRANVVLQRLVRLGMLRMETPGAWRDASPGRPLADRTLDADTRRSAAEADQRLALERDLERTTATLALPSARLPEVRARLARFVEELRELSEDDSERDAVWRVDLRLFPVTRTASEEGDS